MVSQEVKKIVIASEAKQSHHFQPIGFILLDCFVVPLLAMTGWESFYEFIIFYKRRKYL